jgi:tRNA U55 pseudouridine synthase TruB
MALGHIGALDDDAVGVLQILLERRRAAAPE